MLKKLGDIMRNDICTIPVTEIFEINDGCPICRMKKIIEERMELEQFSECAITMSDLAVIQRTIADTLTGVYHHRVKYPNLRYKKRADGRTEGENE